MDESDDSDDGEGGPHTDVQDAAIDDTLERTPVARTTLTVRSGERYRLGKPIGVGGMGEILSAIDEQFGREVAVKRMKQRNPTPHSMDRFFREAAIQGRLDHPAIVPIHELGVDADGRPFFTMKKLTGTTLAQRIAQGHPRQRLLRAFADLCLAVEFAHERGVVHRDLKPQNIVLGDFGEVYILDWGVAKVLEEDLVTTDPDDGIDDPSSTQDGAIVGTIGYMAPEQARGAKDIDAGADIYALGCLLYEILAGAALHPGGMDGLNALIDATYDARPSRHKSSPNVPPELDALCVEAMRHDRTARIQTARMLADRIELFLDGDRDFAMRRQLAQAHLETARAAFVERATVEQHRTCIREAAKALALDPTLTGAAELVGRLMLEPPRETPPEVHAQIRADNLATLRQQARAGARGYVAFLAFLPALVAGGTANLGYDIALVALIALNAVFLLDERGFSRLQLRGWLIAIGNVTLIALLARLGSPLLLAPAVAAVATVSLTMSPTYHRARAAIGLGAGMIAALLVPWLLERVGLVSPTMILGDTIVLDAPLLQISDGARHALLVLFPIGVIAAAVGMGHTNRRLDIDLRHRLHLQAWQLRQLVSE